MYFTLALDIKGKNIVSFKPRLNIKNALLVSLIMVFLIIDNANSAPPSLPPALPKQENNEINNNTEESEDKGSFFKRIFGSEKSDNRVPEKPIQQMTPETDGNNTENPDDFINLGDKKLPILDNSVPEQNTQNQFKNNINDLIPSLPPESQDDLDPYSISKPISTETIPVIPSLQNEVENGNKENVSQIPLELSTVPSSNIGVSAGQATKEQVVSSPEVVPSIPETPILIPKLPSVPPSSKIEVPQVSDQSKKEEVMPSTEVIPYNVQTESVQVPTLPPVLPSSKIEVPQVSDQSKKEEVMPSTEIVPPNRKISPIPVLPPISVPEIEVTKPLVEKKENNTNTPPLPTENITPATSVNGSKESIIIEPTSPKKLWLDKVKIFVQPEKQTPVPVYVQENKPVVEENKNKEKDKKIVKEAQETSVKNKDSLPKRTILSKPQPVEKNVPEKEISEELTQFINNETQMLLLPDDDIILGMLTDEARIDQMEMYSFINMFKQIYDRNKRKNQRQQIDNFIENYSNNFKYNYIVPCNVMNIAFNAIIRNDLFSLRGLLDNYPILRRKGIVNNTLLHIAAEQDNYYIAKFLIIRGVNVNPLNDEFKTALDIAREECNSDIACLIKKRKL